MLPTLHLVALPHTQTTARFSSCAYTQKVRKFVKMMRPLGWRVVLYGSEVTDVEADEHVTIITEAEREGWFGEGFDTVRSPFSWDADAAYWLVANQRATAAIAARAEQRDLLLLTAGTAQQPIAQALPALTCVEWAVGYQGVFSNFHAFESAAWMHYLYGKHGEVNGRFYDAVIPNFFDLDEFEYGAGDGGYLLYLGRLVHRKGVEVAVQIAERAGRKLLIAGPGATSHGPGFVCTDEMELRGDHIEYVGEVGVEERAKLLAGAEALLCPTFYIEPFGGVAVEAMLAGTPAIATDFGAFTETVETGLTGYRFHTLAEGAQAVEDASRLDRAAVRERAVSRYSLQAVGPQFDRWFRQLDGLWDGGWGD